MAARDDVFHAFSDMLQAHVSSVSDASEIFRVDVAKVDRGCCVCCNGYTYKLQLSVSNVFIYFFRRTLQLCLSGCCVYFANGFQLFFRCI